MGIGTGYTLLQDHTIIIRMEYSGLYPVFDEYSGL